MFPLVLTGEPGLFPSGFLCPPFLPVRHRLPANLLPESYNVTLWPRLLRQPLTGLYIFTGDCGAFRWFHEHPEADWASFILTWRVCAPSAHQETPP